MSVQDKQIKKFGTAIILAGGKSTRMGFDKQFLSLNGMRLLDVIIKQLDQEFDDIVLISNTLGFYRDIRVFKDIIKDKGPLGGIHAGLKRAKSQYSYLVACDMPEISLDHIRLMKEKIAGKGKDVCLFKNEPLNAFYSSDLIPEIEEYLKSSNKYSVNAFLKERNICIMKRDNSFVNLNTPKDVENFLARDMSIKNNR